MDFSGCASARGGLCSHAGAQLARRRQRCASCDSCCTRRHGVRSSYASRRSDSGDEWEPATGSSRQSIADEGAATHTAAAHAPSLAAWHDARLDVPLAAQRPASLEERAPLTSPPAHAQPILQRPASPPQHAATEAPQPSSPHPPNDATTQQPTERTPTAASPNLEHEPADDVQAAGEAEAAAAQGDRASPSPTKDSPTAAPAFGAAERSPSPQPRPMDQEPPPPAPSGAPGLADTR